MLIRQDKPDSEDGNRVHRAPSRVDAARGPRKVGKSYCNLYAACETFFPPKQLSKGKHACIDTNRKASKRKNRKHIRRTLETEAIRFAPRNLSAAVHECVCMPPHRP